MILPCMLMSINIELRTQQQCCNREDLNLQWHCREYVMSCTVPCLQHLYYVSYNCEVSKLLPTFTKLLTLLSILIISCCERNELLTLLLQVVVDERKKCGIFLLLAHKYSMFRTFIVAVTRSATDTRMLPFFVGWNLLSMNRSCI